MIGVVGVSVEHVELRVFEPRCDGLGRPLPGAPFRVLATDRRTGNMALRYGAGQLIAIQRAIRAVLAYAGEDVVPDAETGCGYAGGHGSG